MILRSLRFASVGIPFKGKEVTLDFTQCPPGVYAFVGTNGAGKSHVLELCLPGVLYRRFPSYRDPNFVQHATGRQAFAEAIFEAGGRTHKVIVQADPKAGGGRGKTEAYWYEWECWERSETDTWKPKAGPLLADVDAYRDNWFPSLDLLLAGPFCAQKVTKGNGSFFAADPADRKALFVEALGLGRLQELSDEYGKQAADKLKAVLALDGELKGLSTVDVEALQVKRDYLIPLRDGGLDAVEKAQEHAAECSAALRDCRYHADELKAVLTEGFRLDRLIEKKRTAPTAGEVEEAGEELERVAGVVDIRQERVRLDRLLLAEQQRELQAREAARDRDAARLQGVDLLTPALNSVDLSLEMCRKCQLTQGAQAAMREAPALRAALAHGHRAVADYVTIIANQQMNVEKAEAERKDTNKDFDEASRRHALLKLELAAIPDDLDAQITALEQRKGKMPSNGWVLATVEDNAKAADTVLKEARKRLETAQRDLQDVETRLRMGEEAAARRTEIQAQRGVLVEAVGALELLAVGLGPKGLQAVYIDQAGPTVEALTNDLLHQTFGPRFSIAFETRRLKKGKKPTDPDAYSEVFDLRIIDAWANEERQQGSGGETVWFDTAFRLALSIYVTQQTGKDLRTLCFDEPSGQLSADFAPSFTAMLKAARTMGGFHHVLLVSHQREVWGACDGFFCFRDGTVTYVDDVEGVDAMLKPEEL